MFVFILESIGTSELLLVGLIALIFLGPRRMPQMARKMGKIMAEFRGTANEFKETWQREVDLEEEKKIFDLNDLDAVAPVPRIASPAALTGGSDIPAEPLIKEIDPAAIERLKQEAEEDPATESLPLLPSDENDKRNWL